MFEQRPDERQLGAELGYGLMGSSSIQLIQDEQFLKVEPQRIPIVGVAIWMYFVLMLIGTILFWVGENEKLPWVMLVIAGLLIIPTMLGMFNWFNGQLGTEPYLVFNKSDEIVSLPRLSMVFDRQQLHEVLFLDRYVKGNRFWQVALLVEDGSNCWKYLHLFNEAGTGHGMQWLGVKDLYEKVAEGLGIESRRLKFSRWESESLESGG